MSLMYRFKKEKLENGQFVSRPRIFITLEGSTSLEVPALIDTGCDITVIPKALAEILGLDMSRQKDKIYGFCESTEVIPSKVTIKFNAKHERDSVYLNNIPVLIALSKDNADDGLEITLGIQGIFDYFEVIFNKPANQIHFKKLK